MVHLLLQIIKKHDVDSAVKILFEHAGPIFQEQVIKWGAVHADQRRCAEACLHMPGSLDSQNVSWTGPCTAVVTWQHTRRRCLGHIWHLIQRTIASQSLA